MAKGYCQVLIIIGTGHWQKWCDLWRMLNFAYPVKSVLIFNRGPSSRQVKILTTPMKSVLASVHWVFWGLKFEPNVPPVAGGKRGRFAKVSVVSWKSQWYGGNVIDWESLRIIWSRGKDLPFYPGLKKLKLCIWFANVTKIKLRIISPS